MTCGLWRRYVKDPLRLCAKFATSPNSAPQRLGLGRPLQPALRDSETRRALRLLVDHLHPLHRGAPRPLVGEADHLVNRGGLPLERRLDAAIGVVADPAGDAAGLRHAPGRVPEEDALHATVDDDAFTHSPRPRRGSTLRAYSSS